MNREEIKKQEYECPECGHICTENQMLANHTESDQGESWSNWICPQCKYWHIELKDWIKKRRKS